MIIKKIVYLFVVLNLISLQSAWAEKSVLNAYEVENHEEFLHRNGYPNLIVANGWQELDLENRSGFMEPGPTKSNYVVITTLNCHSKQGGKAIVILGQRFEHIMDFNKWNVKTGYPREIKSSPIKILKIKRFLY